MEKIAGWAGGKACGPHAAPSKGEGRSPVALHEKRYVDVIARWRDDGRIIPLVVCWDDGRTFQVDRLVGKPVSDMPPGSPGRTLRYTVMIGSKCTHLYLEQDEAGSKASSRWYVESGPERRPWCFG